MKALLAALFLLAVQLVPAAEPVAYKIEFSIDDQTIFVTSLAGKCLLNIAVNNADVERSFEVKGMLGAMDDGGRLLLEFNANLMEKRSADNRDHNYLAMGSTLVVPGKKRAIATLGDKVLSVNLAPAK